MSLFITKIIKKETKFLATNSKTTKSDLKETETDSEEIIKVHFRINIWMDMVGAKVKIYDRSIGNKIHPDLGQIGELNNESYQDKENQPLFIRNTRLHHLQEDVLDKGPLLNDLLYRQTGPLQQNHPQFVNGNIYQPGQGYDFRYHGNPGNIPRNNNRNRFKKNTGFLGLGNIVSVRW